MSSGSVSRSPPPTVHRNPRAGVRAIEEALGLLLRSGRHQPSVGPGEGQLRKGVRDLLGGGRGIDIQQRRQQPHRQTELDQAGELRGPGPWRGHRYAAEDPGRTVTSQPDRPEPAVLAESEQGIGAVPIAHRGARARPGACPSRSAALRPPAGPRTAPGRRCRRRPPRVVRQDHPTAAGPRANPARQPAGSPSQASTRCGAADARTAARVSASDAPASCAACPAVKPGLQPGLDPARHRLLGQHDHGVRSVGRARSFIAPHRAGRRSPRRCRGRHARRRAGYR